MPLVSPDQQRPGHRGPDVPRYCPIGLSSSILGLISDHRWSCAIIQGGNVCPARREPLERPNLSLEDRELHLASWVVKIVICETKLRQIRQVSGLTTRI